MYLFAHSLSFFPGFSLGFFEYTSNLTTPSVSLLISDNNDISFLILNYINLQVYSEVGGIINYCIILI